MIRRIIIYTFGVCASIVLFMSVAGYLSSIDRNLRLLDGKTRVVRLHLDCDKEHVGFWLDWFHVETPEGESEGWEIHDRILTAAYKVHRGQTQFAGGGKGIRDFKGSSRLQAEMPWWAAASCSGILTFFFLMDVVRSRRHKRRLAAAAATDDEKAASTKPIAERLGGQPAGDQSAPEKPASDAEPADPPKPESS